MLRVKLNNLHPTPTRNLIDIHGVGIPINKVEWTEFEAMSPYMEARRKYLIVEEIADPEKPDAGKLDEMIVKPKRRGKRK